MRRPLAETPALTAGGKTVGRPRKHPPPNAATRITELAADGFSVRGVAMKLGVSHEILNRWLAEHAALKEAFEVGREMERHTLHNALYRLATEQGDKIAAMFLLKARHGYREGGQGDQANRVSINFTLPGAMKPDAFTVENEPSPRTE